MLAMMIGSEGGGVRARRSGRHCPGRRLAPITALCAALFLVQSEAGTLGAARTPWVSNRVVGSPYPPSPYVAERLFPKITFEQPVDFAFMPGSDRLFVVEQSGRIL